MSRRLVPMRAAVRHAVSRVAIRCAVSHRPAMYGALALVIGLHSGLAFCVTTASNFNVAAAWVNACTVSATAVAFGNVSAGAAVANTAGRVTLTCNKGTTVSRVALNNGAHRTGTQKRMLNAATGDFLNYKIDRPTGATFNTCPAAGAGPEWNAANTIVATSLFTTAGGAKPINICASIPAAQYPSAGNYSDTVTVTATYN